MKIILHQSLFKILLILISISITFIIVFISIEFCLHDTSAQKESLTLELSGIFTKKGVISVYYTNNNGKLSNLKKMQDVYYNESGAMQAINFNLDTLPENQRIIIVFNNKCRDNQYIENISYFFPSINKNYSLNCNLHLNISNNYAMYPKEIKQNILKNKFNYPFTIISPSIPKLDFVSTHEHIETLLFSLLFTSIIILITYLLQFPFNIKQFMIINGSWLVYLIIFWGTKDIEFRSFFSDKLSAIPQMEIGMIIPYTEKISLIINNQKYKPFSKENENIIERLVNGSSEIQNLVFPLPCNVNIRKLRLYVGSIPFGTREIHYIRFRKLDKVYDVDLKSISTFFSKSNNIGSIRNDGNKITIEVSYQNPFIETENDISQYIDPVINYKSNSGATVVFSFLCALFLLFWLESKSGSF